MSQYQQYGGQPPIDLGKFKPLFVLGGILIFFIMFGSRMTVTINSGEAGVLFKTFGNGVHLEETYSEGFHFIAPWNKMYVYEVRQQETGDKMTVLSSNGLEIAVDVSIWFQPLWNKLPYLHQEKGQD